MGTCKVKTLHCQNAAAKKDRSPQNSSNYSAKETANLLVSKSAIGEKSVAWLHAAMMVRLDRSDAGVSDGLGSQLAQRLSASPGASIESRLPCYFAGALFQLRQSVAHFVRLLRRHVLCLTDEALCRLRRLPNLADQAEGLRGAADAGLGFGQITEGERQRELRLNQFAGGSAGSPALSLWLSLASSSRRHRCPPECALKRYDMGSCEY